MIAAPRQSLAQTPAHLRKWVGLAGGRHHFPISTHGETTAYQSAAAERLWLDGRRKGRICETAELPASKRAVKLWLRYSTRAWLPGGKPAPEATPEENKALSHFRRGSRVEPIEPLTGFARHPHALLGCPGRRAHLPREKWEHKNKHFDVRYIVPHNDCARLSEPGPQALKPRVLLFDLGASVGFQGVPGGVYAETPASGGTLAPSLPLFYRIYADRCLEPDDIFAWEPNPGARGPEFWGELPGAIRAKVRFFDTPVMEAESPGAKHPPSSFLDILQTQAEPEDFVVVKLDIDTPSVELTIAEAIAERPDIAALIDELYFEYHFWLDGMEDLGWQAVDGDVDTAMGLMHRLRELGIRAHFWI